MLCCVQVLGGFDLLVESFLLVILEAVAPNSKSVGVRTRENGLVFVSVKKKLVTISRKNEAEERNIP